MTTAGYITRSSICKVLLSLKGLYLELLLYMVNTVGLGLCCQLCLLVAVMVSNTVTTVQKGAAGGGYHCSKCKVKSVMFMLLRDDCIINTVGDKYDLMERCNCGTDLQVMSKSLSDGVITNQRRISDSDSVTKCLGRKEYSRVLSTASCLLILLGSGLAQVLLLLDFMDNSAANGMLLLLKVLFTCSWLSVYGFNTIVRQQKEKKLYTIQAKEVHHVKL
nr:hypothetical protein [Tanacetum cinerariifolium]